ncbi:MAG: HAD-IIIC family phosphatase [Thermoflexaceae bacterium]|nr:HAD-IIIC family phosphatase [Thermoflexaceae bacterium]
MKELEYPFDSEYILKKKKSIKKALLESGGKFLDKKIAILGGSTTNDIKLILELFLLNYGIRPEFYESEYNQYWQDAMFPNEELMQFQPDIIYIHTTNRNISSYPSLSDDMDTVEGKLQGEYERFEQMWNRIFDVYRCPVIQNNFEYPGYRLMGNMEASDYHGRINFITRLNQRFYEYAQKHENFYINDINYISACYGLDRWQDDFYWHMYKYAMAVPAIPELAFNIARIIKSVYGKNKKALVLDLDNTLWGGVVGDDGVENLAIGQEVPMGQVYTEFQEYIKAHKDIGVLLNVNSKNEYENAIAGLNHPDGVLKPDDFIVIKANWDNKDKNIVDMANELNIMPDSMVFVDDNPAERTIVETSVPGVAVPPMESPEKYIRMLDRSGFFEVTSLSADDAKRNEMYKENVKRAQLMSSYDNYEDYLKSLEMTGTIKAFEPVYMARIAQLTNKSNQFNLTTKRLSQADIEAMAADSSYITLYGKLEDKFGDNGVVSVVIGKIEGNVLHIELWLMSCRVLKRDMEYAMMDTFVARALERNITTIKGYYYPTAKNGMVKNFYAQMGFEKTKEDNDGNTVWTYDIDSSYNKKNNVIKVVE